MRIQPALQNSHPRRAVFVFINNIFGANPLDRCSAKHPSALTWAMDKTLTKRVFVFVFCEPPIVFQALAPLLRKGVLREPPPPAFW